MQAKINFVVKLIVVVISVVVSIAAFYANGSSIGALTTLVAIASVSLTVFRSDIQEVLEKWLGKKRRLIGKRGALRKLNEKSQNKSKNYDIVCLSALNYDSIFRVEIFKPDREFEATAHSSFAGGSGANTGYLMARLGAKVAVAGIVGSEEFGSRMLRELEEAQIDTTRIEKIDNPSGTTAIISDALGQRYIAVNPAANLEIKKLFENKQKIESFRHFVSRAKIFHVSSFIQHQLIYKQMAEVINGLPSDILLSYVPGDIQSKNGVDEDYNKVMLVRADCLFIYEKHFLNMINKSRVDVSRGANNTRQYVENFLKWRARNGADSPILICLKSEIVSGKSHNNEDYLSIYVGTDEILDEVHSNTLKRPPFSPVFDATGAGDAAAAGALIGLLKGCGLQEIATHAYNTSLAVASKLGPRSGVEDVISLGETLSVGTVVIDGP